MTSKINLALGTLLLAMPVTVYAHHSGSEAITRLHDDTNRLESVVQTSWLRYRVKSAVHRLSNEVSAYFQCSATEEPGDDEPGGTGPGGDEPGGTGPGPVGANPSVSTRDHTDPVDCESKEQQVRRAWSIVNRYLYDSYYDLPQVYEAYVQVRQDIQGLE